MDNTKKIDKSVQLTGGFLLLDSSLLISIILLKIFLFRPYRNNAAVGNDHRVLVPMSTTPPLEPRSITEYPHRHSSRRTPAPFIAG